MHVTMRDGNFGVGRSRHVQMESSHQQQTSRVSGVFKIFKDPQIDCY